MDFEILLFTIELPQCVGAFVGARDCELDAVEVTWFGLSNVTFEENWCTN